MELQSVRIGEELFTATPTAPFIEGSTNAWYLLNENERQIGTLNFFTKDMYLVRFNNREEFVLKVSEYEDKSISFYSLF